MFDAEMKPNTAQRIRSLIDLKKFDLALREARRALGQNPDQADVQYLYAWLLWQQKRLIEATGAASTALRLAPDDADTHSLLAMILQERPGEAARADEHHRKALALAPNDAVFHARYADFLWPRGSFAAAWKHVEEALQLDARLVGAYYVKAMMLQSQQRFREAEEVIREALALAPTDAYAHELLGINYLNQYQSKQAFPHLREALRLEPTNHQYKRKLIEALETDLPLLGKFWHFTHMLHTHERQVLLYYLLIYPVLCCLLNPALFPLFVAVACLDVLLGSVLFVLNYVVEPWMTQAVMEGKITL